MDAELKKYLIDKLKDLIDSLGSGIQLLLGIIATVIVTVSALSGEILDDISTYKDTPIDWMHVAKVAIPPVMVSVGAFIKHRQLVQIALRTPVPNPMEK